MAGEWNLADVKRVTLRFASYECQGVEHATFDVVYHGPLCDGLRNDGLRRGGQELHELLLGQGDEMQGLRRGDEVRRHDGEVRRLQQDDEVRRHDDVLRLRQEHEVLRREGRQGRQVRLRQADEVRNEVRLRQRNDLHGNVREVRDGEEIALRDF